MSEGATVEGDAPLRLFLGLQIPDDAAAELRAWGERHLRGGRRLESFHVTLAFLGPQPRAALGGILVALREEAHAAAPFTLEPVRYRETRSVGMLVLSDPSGSATSLAERLHARLRTLGVYEAERRRWLPHVTVLRFREQPQLEPPLPEIAPFAPSGAAAYLSRPHPSGARYEVLESCSLGV